MHEKNSLKHLIHKLLYRNRKVIRFVYALIILNIIALILESVEDIRKIMGFELWLFEVFSVVIFTIEYLSRLYVSNIHGPKRMKYAFSFYGIIDLLAIIPFYLPFVFILDLRVLRILRIFRLIRIFKLGRFNKSFRTIKDVLVSSKSELLMTIFIAFIMLLISSTLMYYAESEVQPEKFQSIPHAFWWAIATLTTVGYGDVYPITALGKFLSSIIAIVGIGFVALPTGIISSAFIDKIKIEETINCPHCGKKVQ